MGDHLPKTRVRGLVQADLGFETSKLERERERERERDLMKFFLLLYFELKRYRDRELEIFEFHGKLAS